MPLLKLDRLAVNWPNQPEMMRRYWDKMCTAIENIGAFTGIISGGTGIDFDTTTGVISLDPANDMNSPHAGIDMIAGVGLTGGGDITADRTFNVGAGTGIVVNANDVAVSSTLAAYSGGDVPSAFTLSIVDSVDGPAWRTAIGAGTSSTTGTVTSVAFSGGTTGLTASGSPITTAGTFTLSGTLSVANGGTGVTASTGSTAVVLSNLPQFTSTIGVGVAASASGSGVSFPATQSASTDPNTLDDYEEGTWTPTVAPNSGSITAYTATGTYTKIGRQVTAALTITITNNGTGAGNIQASLPFAASTVFVGVGREGSITGNILQALTNAASSTLTILDYANAYPGGGGTATARTVYATVTYFV